jgi:hypothetical protein
MHQGFATKGDKNMKSRWLVLMMAAFLVFLGSPMGVLACQKAMNTAHYESEDMGLSSSGSEYGSEEMAPAYPEGEEQKGMDEMTPSSPGLNEFRDELNSSSQGTDEQKDEMFPSGTDEWRDDMGSFSGTDEWRDEMGSSSGTDEWRDEMAPSSPEGFELQGERGLLDDWRDEMTPSSPEGYTDQEELTPSGSDFYFDEYSNQGSSADQGSEFYYP